MQEVAPEYDFLESSNIDTILSVGNHSQDWHERTFKHLPPATLSNLAVITGNPFADIIPDDVGEIVNLFEKEWSNERNTVLAQSVTDYMVPLGRTSEFDQYLAHYMQPHPPFFKPGKSREEPIMAANWYEMWGSILALMRGEISEEELKELHLNNLRYVLNDVEILLENFDADTAAITADHAHCLGEGGMYGHPAYTEHPELKRVPWVEVETVDEKKLDPSISGEKSISISKEERLQALGYR